MASKRQQQFLGQSRVDAPHLRLVEAGVAGDLDALAGAVLAGGVPQIVKGFAIIGTGINQASKLLLRVAGGRVIHPTASDSGSIYTVADDEADEVLGATNAHVVGSFAPNQVNFVGLDLLRQTDDSTNDLVMFLSTSTLTDSPRRVPLARTLQRRIVITTVDPSATPGLAPIARVTTDSANNIVTIEDSRNMMWRLGSGGSSPNALHAYQWLGGRSDATDFTVTGDKQFESAKDWADGIMTRLWELGGGERWFSPTADRNAVLTGSSTTFVSSGENFEWTGTNLHWQGLAFLFDNSTGTVNEIVDQVGNTSGLTDLADGECLYVDVDRAANRTGGAALLPVKAVLATLGVPPIPGSRYIIAWRHGSSAYYRGKVGAIGAVNVPAATTVTRGSVLLSGTPGSVPNPSVATINAAGNAIAPGLSRAGYTGGNGSVSVGPDTSADSAILYGNVSMAGGHTFDGAPGAATNVLMRNRTDSNITNATSSLKLQQLNSAVLKDVFEVEGSGALSLISTFYTPPTPGAGKAKVYVRTNGLSTPNTRLQLVIRFPVGVPLVIAESDLF